MSRWGGGTGWPAKFVHQVATVAVSSAGLVHCGSHAADAPGSGTQEPWRQALTRLASGTAIYSFDFDGAPPSGALVTVAVDDTDAASACARYSAASGASDFWYIETTINDENKGEHLISLAQFDGTTSATANVTLLHRSKGALTESYDALAGSVSVTSNPAPQQAASNSYVGHLEADFPLHAMREVDCRGAATAAGVVFSACTCEDSDGVQSTCTPSGMENCCHDLRSPTLHVSIPFSASHCPAMCTWVAGGTDYCAQFFGP